MLTHNLLRKRPPWCDQAAVPILDPKSSSVLPYPSSSGTESLAHLPFNLN